MGPLNGIRILEITGFGQDIPRQMDREHPHLRARNRFVKVAGAAR